VRGVVGTNAATVAFRRMGELVAPFSGLALGGQESIERSNGAAVDALLRPSPSRRQPQIPAS
jgi:hypothetical protein